MRTERAGESFVLVLEGELDLSSAERVRETLVGAIGGGERSVLVDMLECTFVDSTGLGVLLHSAKRLDGEGQMAIACVDEQIRRLFGLTMIDRTIPVFASRDEALAHLSG